MPLGEKQQLDREIRDMISALTRRLAHLHNKPNDGAGGATSFQDQDQDQEEADDGGVGIITMAGSNEGATMRGELDLMISVTMEDSIKQDHDDQSLPPFTTYLNNNFQGVNNSIMLGGSYSANDPGVHLDVDDHYQQQPAPAATHRHGKKGKKKKAHSGSSTTDHSS